MRSATIVLLAVLLLQGCARQAPPKDSKRTAEEIGKLTPNQQQARLWKEAADKGATAGVERLQMPSRPVQNRERPAAANRSLSPQNVTIPAGVQGAVRVLSAPEVEPSGFSGVAEVARVEGERIDLNLGQNRILAIHARARGSALQTKVGERVQVDYRVRTDPFDRRQILAVRTTAGDGIVSVLEGGPKPVAVQVPLFRLVASQTGSPQKGSMPVEVRVGDVRRTMTQGQIAEFPGLTVGLLASSAYVGPDAYRAEGNPYSVDLVAWPSRKAPAPQ
jgi:hypothetical protein